MLSQLHVKLFFLILLVSRDKETERLVWEQMFKAVITQVITGTDQIRYKIKRYERIKSMTFFHKFKNRIDGKYNFGAGLPPQKKSERHVLYDKQHYWFLKLSAFLKYRFPHFQNHNTEIKVLTCSSIDHTTTEPSQLEEA